MLIFTFMTSEINIQNLWLLKLFVLLFYCLLLLLKSILYRFWSYSMSVFVGIWLWLLFWLFLSCFFLSLFLAGFTSSKFSLFCTVFFWLKLPFALLCFWKFILFLFFRSFLFEPLLCSCRSFSAKLFYLILLCSNLILSLLLFNHSFELSLLRYCILVEHMRSVAVRGNTYNILPSFDSRPTHLTERGCWVTLIQTMLIHLLSMRAIAQSLADSLVTSITVGTSWIISNPIGICIIDYRKICAFESRLPSSDWHATRRKFRSAVFKLIQTFLSRLKMCNIVTITNAMVHLSLVWINILYIFHRSPLNAKICNLPVGTMPRIKVVLT